MARTKVTTNYNNIQQETLFGPHQLSLFVVQKTNTYKEKQRARKERYENRAASAREQAVTESNEAASMLKVIPDCQPIHVGHHSERGHRSLLKRSNAKIRKSIACDEKSDYYENKAKNIGKGGISSDDPEAIEKIEKKLKDAEEKQDNMKAANRILRKNPKDKSGLMALGFSEKESEELIYPPHWMSSIGFPNFSLTNNRSKIRHLSGRLKVLKRNMQAETVEIVKESYTFRHDVEENRLMFIFDENPNENIQSILKGRSFKWSPRRGAWVRQVTGNGFFAARHVRKELNALAAGSFS